MNESERELLRKALDYCTSHRVYPHRHEEKNEVHMKLWCGLVDDLNTDLKSLEDYIVIIEFAFGFFDPGLKIAREFKDTGTVRILQEVYGEFPPSDFGNADNSALLLLHSLKQWEGLV